MLLERRVTFRRPLAKRLKTTIASSSTAQGTMGVVLRLLVTRADRIPCGGIAIARPTIAALPAVSAR